jgi:hypothetical protein
MSGSDLPDIGQELFGQPFSALLTRRFGINPDNRFGI